MEMTQSSNIPRYSLEVGGRGSEKAPEKGREEETHLLFTFSHLSWYTKPVFLLITSFVCSDKYEMYLIIDILKVPLRVPGGRWLLF